MSTITQTSGLTWIASAIERVEKARMHLSDARVSSGREQTYALARAEDELRTAVNHVEDSIRSLKRDAP